MNDSYCVFKWTLNPTEEKSIIEKIPVPNYETYLSINGTIAEEIFSVCAIRSIEQENYDFAFDTKEILDSFTGEFLVELKEIAANYLQEENLSRENYISINYDLLEKIAFGYVCNTCQKNPNGIEKTSKNDDVLKIINEIIGNALIPNTNKRENQFEPPVFDGKYGLSKFEELIDKIKKSNIKKDYIKTNGTRKCIALYKKWGRKKENTIAFSGHNDCDNDNLYDFFGVKNKRYEDYKQIAKAIGAELAGTSYYVSRYDFVSNNSNVIVRKDPIGEIIIKRNRLHSDYYSCCERKIFAFLDDRYKCVYSGKLFVKYPPCKECMFAIFYHLTSQGKLFSMSVGLPK